MREIAKGFAPPSFDCDRIERFSCPTNFGDRYFARLAKAPNIRVLLDAHAVEILPDDGGSRIRRVLLRTLEGEGRPGKEIAVEADEFVIAAGGIETARLLLASRARHEKGIGNAHDLVGRNYMCHIAGTIGDHARKRGMTPAQFAVNWVLNNGLVSSAIVGPRTAEQMAEYVGALDHRFEAQDEALVASLVPAGHPSTPGYSDPAYPIEGRQARAG